MYSGDGGEKDNALLLCLEMLHRLGIRTAYLAGFDGFTIEGKDYYDTSYSFAGNAEFRMLNNEKICNELKNMSDKINIEFITTSVYQ